MNEVFFFFKVLDIESRHCSCRRAWFLAYNHLKLQFQGIQHILLSSEDISIHVHIHTHTHKELK